MSPPDTQSRLAIVLLVGFFFFMIPRELNKLNHLLDLSSKYTVSTSTFPLYLFHRTALIPHAFGRRPKLAFRRPTFSLPLGAESTHDRLCCRRGEYLYG